MVGGMKCLGRGQQTAWKQLTDAHGCHKTSACALARRSVRSTALAHQARAAKRQANAVARRVCWSTARGDRESE
eukprot:3932500-Rhodomonas_salina.2